VVLDAPDAQALAGFYAELLGWRVSEDEPDWMVLSPLTGFACLAFQTESGYVRPVWPSTDGQQQMMLHLDFEVADLGAAVEHAVELGATLAELQPQDDVRVLLDPVGHPFCLYVDH
jgi:catechol 2,3-dioxygenase-like lactoylglutathione lyase family enzyme